MIAILRVIIPKGGKYFRITTENKIKIWSNDFPDEKKMQTNKQNLWNNNWNTKTNRNNDSLG